MSFYNLHVNWIERLAFEKNTTIEKNKQACFKSRKREKQMAPLTPNVLSSHLFHFLHMVFVNGLMENVTGVAAERLIQTI